ncbi:hypothetical protein GCM10011611_28960 [Aliidongia dinghuensis]|uniref:C-type lysozyme inhibitor domain-containing protein n=1 Tax=Aliidongia dinghuensis TaxID=1867774 RepID=A0A8J3E5E2_9PROT|nr:hypothetical protein [Aliidongia dinghuensis]GGF21075.1 hypothetical protein GCM10011611_28960 [Aliidongia dinghuensis]
MSRVLPLCVVFILLWGSVQAAAGQPEQAARDYLEGIWLTNKRPDASSCLAEGTPNTQIEFDFRKSGGRILVFEPPDLFSAIAIPEISVENDIITVRRQRRDGSYADDVRLRRLSPDQFEILSASGGKPGDAYRCDDASTQVDDAIPSAMLQKLTPDITGSQGFIEVDPAVSDADLCQGNAPAGRRSKPRWLQFELLGPAHYWIFGEGFRSEHRLIFDYVRAVRQVDDHTLRLEMQEHLETSGGWDSPGSGGETYTLTIVDQDSRIFVPELSATFVRCSADQPGSIGMHRW